MGALFAVGSHIFGRTVIMLPLPTQISTQSRLTRLQAYSRSYRQALRRQDEFLRFLRQINEIPDNSTKELEHCEGNVKIENVNFSYTKEKPLITNFSLDVKSGSHIAIVGPTGCGKTTFINFLMRFFISTDSAQSKAWRS